MPSGFQASRWERAGLVSHCPIQKVSMEQSSKAELSLLHAPPVYVAYKWLPLRQAKPGKLWPGVGSYAQNCKVHLWVLWVWLALRESSTDFPLQNRSCFYRGRTAFRQLIWPANSTCLSCFTCHAVRASHRPHCNLGRWWHSHSPRSAGFSGGWTLFSVTPASRHRRLCVCSPILWLRFAHSISTWGCSL